MGVRKETKTYERSKRMVAEGDVTGNRIFLCTIDFFEESPAYREDEIVNETLQLPEERFDEGTKENVQMARALSL